MQKINGQAVFSASDLVHFLDCEHLTSLNRVDLDPPLQRGDDGAQAELVQMKGLEHEARHLQSLFRAGARVLDLKAKSRNLDVAIRSTAEAMREGRDNLPGMPSKRPLSGLGRLDAPGKSKRLRGFIRIGKICSAGSTPHNRLPQCGRRIEQVGSDDTS